MFVLIHSPLIGPFTWSRLVPELEARSQTTLVPNLHTEFATTPYWHHHARAVADVINKVPASTPLILVGHSGAGMLLPAIRQAIGRSVSGYVFMDAGIPVDGKSRLDLLRIELPDAAEQAARVGLQPQWTDQDLRDDLPDAALRVGVLAELHTQPLPYRTEPIPVAADWPDAPCGYLQFTAGYDHAGMQARAAGWAYASLPAGHFHMLVDPIGVADALVALVTRMGNVPSDITW